MEDSPKPKSKGPSKWKRPPTRVYDYNYDVGQHYYKPMLNHLDKKGSGASVDPPGPTTFAERLAVDPLYGRLKPLDKVSSDYTPVKSTLPYTDDVLPSRKYASEEPLSGASGAGGDDGCRPSRFALPSVSDQILDGAGINMDTTLDEFLANLRKRREKAQAETDELLKDPFFAKLVSRKGDDEEELPKPRRNILNDLNSVAKMDDASLGNYSTAGMRKLALNESAAVSSASMSSQVSSSVNIRKRNVKTTITTETVRY